MMYDRQMKQGTLLLVNPEHVDTPILLSCKNMVQRLYIIYDVQTANFSRTTMCMTLQLWYIVHANEQQEIEVELTTLLVPF